MHGYSFQRKQDLALYGPLDALIVPIVDQEPMMNLEKYLGVLSYLPSKMEAPVHVAATGMKNAWATN